jgi:sulfur carrier protein ThiS
VIRVNDKWDVPWHEGMTVDDLLAACKFTLHYVAVACTRWPTATGCR